MRTIRQSAFETNSSSSHAFAIKKNSTQSLLKYFRKNYLEIIPDTFERGDYELSTPESKISYIYTAIMLISDGRIRGGSWGKLKSTDANGYRMLNPSIEVSESPEFEMLRSNLETLGVKYRIIPEAEINNEVCIGHGDFQYITMYILSDIEVFKRFIFDPESYIRISSDESSLYDWAMADRRNNEYEFFEKTN